VAKLEVLLWNLAGGSEGSRENPVRIVGVPADIRTGHIPTTSQEDYRLSQLARCERCHVCLTDN
jgi:hypothetical protein